MDLLQSDQRYQGFPPGPDLLFALIIFVLDFGGPRRVATPGTQEFAPVYTGEPALAPRG